MSFQRTQEKLKILADAAKYDVSCSSSGSKRNNTNKGLGDASGMGICHSYTEDGRCVSLLKILLTNHCIFDCAYCVTRKSNDIKRAAFKVQEVVDLTISFYRRNYIEGLFLSSGIFKDANYTMERLVAVAKKLRLEENFNGYIHLKSIPGASDELMHEAGLYADRLSVNIEIPTEEGLKRLAPDKKREDFIKPMLKVKNDIVQYQAEKKVIRNTPKFAPAGQSTQMIIGASGENDFQIMQTSNLFYKTYNLKRVYYSGYIPISYDARLPQIGTAVPMMRENRLYQTDWLMRFYGFDVSEILNETHQNLDLDIDPKLGWALRNLHEFPVDVNTADKRMLARIPGLGMKSVYKILNARRFRRLNWEHLKKIGIALNRAQYFVVCDSNQFERRDLSSKKIKGLILQNSTSKYAKTLSNQLSLFA
ncbi:putative DNA modification/repair radical SAM protein [Subsaximicrobium wynnwilliamsii]|uniref:Putative DNA modification/repair radical SAM protein n=1 Tax=Subsaximicrobium wynnwilliamsii TaxID=291179 RepID=A0A5C6ZL45_9FLAO|nr:putative DNA modification/repair radical SAM protein [Subsaximicrobium wynnwilliamsii]TXD85025.1 putative DNA modification/repair radical SAM protein [Subsaximicrobium wynnwilliamsii]TXD91068.1 putative DNA modification/repair radical SAM protein [Subsaximicrobium wynnwilliamsii]TXE04462.1 putative DNA modification/repair radical SAM protein [Subsaximicrobium wynnwilliamsii]